MSEFITPIYPKDYNLEENIEIKKALSEDAAEVAAILRHGAKLKLQRGDRAWEWRNFTEEVLREWIEKDNNFYTVRLGETAAACFALTWEDPLWGKDSAGECYIHKLAVHEDYRGQGLGEIILDSVATHAAQNGSHFLRLDFPQNNHGQDQDRLKRYYEGLGFMPATPNKVEIDVPYGVYRAHLHQRDLR